MGIPKFPSLSRRAVAGIGAGSTAAGSAGGFAAGKSKDKKTPYSAQNMRFAYNKGQQDIVARLRQKMSRQPNTTKKAHVSLHIPTDILWGTTKEARSNGGGFSIGELAGGIAGGPGARERGAAYGDTRGRFEGAVGSLGGGLAGAGIGGGAGALRKAGKKGAVIGAVTGSIAGGVAGQIRGGIKGGQKAKKEYKVSAATRKRVKNLEKKAAARLLGSR